MAQVRKLRAKPNPKRVELARKRLAKQRTRENSLTSSQLGAKGRKVLGVNSGESVVFVHNKEVAQAHEFLRDDAKATGIKVSRPINAIAFKTSSVKLRK